MDDKTLQYMADRVKKGEQLRSRIDRLKKFLSRMEVDRDFRIYIGNNNGCLSLHDIITTEGTLELCGDGVRNAIEEYIATLEDQYAKL